MVITQNSDVSMHLQHDPEETKTVARALLPGDIMEGNKLLYENLQYRIIVD